MARIANDSRLRKVTVLGAACAALLATSACTAVIDRRGFLPEDDAQTVITAGTDTKTSVLTRLGNPSQQGVFDQQVWYYMSAVDSSQAFFMPKAIERRIIAVSFDDDDRVSDVRQYTMADGRVVEYNRERTPTRGREVTFLEQILGSVGNAPVQLPGGDPNLPQGSGGPRRQ